jgi:ABC-type branched-subunit amino acid transport system substrate-binding protein
MVKIGFSSILSGPPATAGQGTDAGTEAYLKMLNAQGGINGYKFTFDEKDNKYDPAKAATVARDLVNDGVFTIVSEGTEPLKATVPITDPQNIPVFTEADGEIVTPPKGQYQHVYGINPSYHGVCAAASDFILNHLHQKKAALVYLDNDGETIASKAFPAAYKARGGTLLDTEAVQVTTTDYTPFAQKLKNSGAKVVYAYILDSQLPGLQKAAAAIGYHPKWVTWFDPYTHGYLKLAGNLSNGVYLSYFPTPLNQTSDPNVKQYKKAMRKYAPSQLGTEPSAAGWTFGAAIAEAVKRATTGGKKLTAQGFEDALNTFDHENLGLVKSMTYNSQTHAGATRVAFYQIQKNGSLKKLTPYKELPSVQGG